MAGKVGRPPKPTALRVLGGNAGHRSLPNEAPTRPGSPRREPWLDKCTECSQRWEDACLKLSFQRLLSPDWGLALDALCLEWHEYHSARERIHARELQIPGSGYTQITDKGYIAVHPDVGIANKAFTNAMGLNGEFGGTPSSNTRLRVPPAEDEGAEQTEEWFGGGAKRA